MHNLIYDPLFKGAIHINSLYEPRVVKFSKGEILKRIIRKPFITESCGLSMMSNNKLFDVLDLKIQQLVAAGIIDYHLNVNKKLLDPNYYKKPKLLTREYLEKIYVKSFPEGPQVLTLEHLEAGFVVWLCCSSLALLTFVCEWILLLKDCLLIKYILSAFYEWKRMEPNLKILVNDRPLSSESITDKENKQQELMITIQSESNVETKVDLTSEMQFDEVKLELSEELKSEFEEGLMVVLLEEMTDTKESLQTQPLDGQVAGDV